MQTHESLCSKWTISCHCRESWFLNILITYQKGDFCRYPMQCHLEHQSVSKNWIIRIESSNRYKINGLKRLLVSPFATIPFCNMKFKKSKINVEIQILMMMRNFITIMLLNTINSTQRKTLKMGGESIQAHFHLLLRFWRCNQSTKWNLQLDLYKDARNK